MLGAPDDRYGQQVVAIVAPAPVVGTGDDAPHLTLAALQDHCRTHLAGYKLPRALHLVDTVARTDAGKVDYTWARAVLASALDAERTRTSRARARCGPRGSPSAVTRLRSRVRTSPVRIRCCRRTFASAAPPRPRSARAVSPPPSLFAARTGREQEMTVDTRHAARRVPQRAARARRRRARRARSGARSHASTGPPTGATSSSTRTSRTTSHARSRCSTRPPTSMQSPRPSPGGRARSSTTASPKPAPVRR